MDVWSFVQNWWNEWAGWWWSALGSLLVMLGFAGCGVNPEMTDVQAAKDVEVKMMWLDKLANLAERHNLAWQANVDVGGKPSIGETAALFFDTDTSMRVAVHANAAAARPTDSALARLTEGQLNMIVDAIMGVLNRQLKVPLPGDSEVENVPDGTASDTDAVNEGALTYALDPNEEYEVEIRRGDQPPERITFMDGRVVGKLEGL